MWTISVKLMWSLCKICNSEVKQESHKHNSIMLWYMQYMKDKSQWIIFLFVCYTSSSINSKNHLDKSLIKSHWDTVQKDVCFFYWLIQHEQGKWRIVLYIFIKLNPLGSLSHCTTLNWNSNCEFIFHNSKLQLCIFL